MAGVLAASSSQADVSCFSVSGSYTEHVEAGPQCQSPVGLCIAGEYRGGVRGGFEGRATTIVGTADTPATGIQLFTSDSTIEATVRGRNGTLVIKNSGAFGATGDGPIVDLQTIIGGTGELTGATGALRATGTFSFATGQGESQYRGIVCLP